MRLEARPRRHERLDRHRIRAGEAGSPCGNDAGAHAEWTEVPPPLPRVLDGLHVLVVDDDTDVLDLFAAALAACGARVTAVDNARDALAVLGAASPHVVVSDIAMVREDGYWFVREVRRMPGGDLRRTPVIAATAYGREHPRARVLAAGFTEHVLKPIDPEALCRIVARVAGR